MSEEEKYMNDLERAQLQLKGIGIPTSISDGFLYVLVDDKDGHEVGLELAEFEVKWRAARYNRST